MDRFTKRTKIRSQSKPRISASIIATARLLVPLGCLAVLGGLPDRCLRAQDKGGTSRATVDVVTPQDASFDISLPFQIQVLGRGAPAEIIGAVFAVVDDNTGQSLSSGFTMGEARAVINSLTTISVTVDQQKLKQTVSAKGSLFLQYRAEGSGDVQTGQRWSFNLIRPAPEVAVAAHPIAVTRMVPFTDEPIGAGQTNACLSYLATPDLLSLPVKTVVPGEIYTAGNDASRIPGLNLQAAVAEHSQLCLTTSIPGQYTELKGKLWLRQPSVKKPVEIDVDLRVKDAWGWRALAILFSTGLALGVMYWTNKVRRRLLNRAQRDEVSNRLAQFLAANPALTNHDSVVFVRQLLLNSAVDDREGEFDLSVQSLQSASARLDQLIAMPPAAPVALAASGQAIRIVNPSWQLLSGEKIVFVIGQPNANWPAKGGNYAWAVAPAGTVGAIAIAKVQGVDRTKFTATFEAAGTYQVQVMVNAANPETRNFTILKRPSSRTIRDFKIVGGVIIGLTFLLAAGTAFVSTQDAATFGTAGDYLKLFVTAFGVAGAGGVTAIFTALRR